MSTDVLPIAHVPRRDSDEAPRETSESRAEQRRSGRELVARVRSAVAAVSARVSSARAALALRTIQDILTELSTPLAAERVARAQATVLRNRVTTWTTGSALLYDLVLHAGPTGDLTYFRSFGDDLRAVTPSDVAALFASCATHVVAVAAGPDASRAGLGSAAAIDREAEYRALRSRKSSATAPAPGVALR